MIFIWLRPGSDHFHEEHYKFNEVNKTGNQAITHLFHFNTCALNTQLTMQTYIGVYLHLLSRLLQVHPHHHLFPPHVVAQPSEVAESQPKLSQVISGGFCTYC